MKHTLLDALRVRLLARRSAARTVTTYLALAGEFLSDLGPEPPRRMHVELFLARPRIDGGVRAASSFNQALSALRVLGNVAVTEAIWPVDPTAGISMLKVPRKEPNFLDRIELTQMFRAAASLPTPHERARELALLAVFATTGLRVSELQALNVDQVEYSRGRLLDVLGKGSTKYHVALPTSALILMQEWLGYREQLAAAGERGLFVGDAGRRWSIRTLQRHVNALAVRAEFTRRVGPHALRHSVGTLGLAIGIDLASLSDVLRHADITTTKRYIHLATERRRMAAARLDTLIPPEALPLGSSAQASVIEDATGLDSEYHFDDARRDVA